MLMVQEKITFNMTGDFCNLYNLEVSQETQNKMVQYGILGEEGFYPTS